MSNNVRSDENREWIAYQAIRGSVNWKDFYRGTSLEDVVYYDHFSRNQTHMSVR